MKNTYKIEVDCANCANLIEAAVQKINGVHTASVSFITQKIVVEFCDNADIRTVLGDIVKASKRIEPDFVLEV